MMDQLELHFALPFLFFVFFKVGNMMLHFSYEANVTNKPKVLR